jgi:NAD(P)-dependent dehydrogenase (short-subunit alcohol dehydrogenase family)
MNILITGANRGIGLELARIASARKHTVIATARKPDEARELATITPHVLALDVSDEAAIAALGTTLADAKRFPMLKDAGLDVLINNAGVSSTAKQLAELTSAELTRVFMVNTFAPLLVTKACMDLLRRGKHKLVLHITSQLGSIANNTGGSSYPYRASKAALNQLNRSLAAELGAGAGGFTCIAAHPGWVQTDMGGPNAPLTPAQSAEHLLRIAEESDVSRNGAFLNYDGAKLPW